MKDLPFDFYVFISVLLIHGCDKKPTHIKKNILLDELYIQKDYLIYMENVLDFLGYIEILYRGINNKRKYYLVNTKKLQHELA